jgi:hypothetical protein
VKASFAGSRDAIDNRGALRRRSALLILAATVAAALVFGVSASSATAPTVTMGTATNPGFTTVEVTGEVNPEGEPTEYFYEVSTDGVNWERVNINNFESFSEATTPQSFPGTIEGLKAETTYRVRLSAINYNEGEGAKVSSPPSSQVTTLGPVPKPTVTIDPVSTFTATTAHFSGKIDPGAANSDPGFKVHWHFVCEPDCLNLSNNGAGEFADDGNEHTVQTDAAIEPNTAYVIKLVAENAGGEESAQTPLQSGKAGPIVQTIPAFAIEGGTKALLGGTVNPRNDATTYWVEYGLTTSYGQKYPLAPASAGSGGKAEYETEEVTGLTPSSVYHFRLVAENSSGPSNGFDMNFETAPAGPSPSESCPNAALRAENNSEELPECRAYEQVSPVDKNGFDAGDDIGYPEVGATLLGSRGQSVAAAGGSAITFESRGAFADTRSASLLSAYLARRSASGWASHSLLPPQLPGAHVPAALSTARWYSPDLSKAVLRIDGGPALAPGAIAGKANFYLADTATDAYTTLSAEPADFVEASADFKTVFFNSPEVLAPGGIEGVRNLYESHNGEVKLASILPGGAPSPGGSFVGPHSVSEDGSRVLFFEDNGLDLRENGQTVQIGEGVIANCSGTCFKATPDLSQVFYVSAEKLTPDAVNGQDQIYRYDTDSKTLTLITPPLVSAGFGVEGMAGISRDGSYVYFRAVGQYNPGEGSTDANLYVWHDGVISLIAIDPGFLVSTLEAPHLTYRVSPDGKHLSFNSVSQLTNYDNTDSTLDENGQPRADREVYTYDAVQHRLTCVSCNPSGERPTGSPGARSGSSYFPEPPDFQGLNLQPGVGDDGHIFFNSRDALVPNDVNGKADVYEWKDGRVHLISGGTGGGDSFYASSSVSGNDAFLVTRQQLAASDNDQNVDVYDARVGGGFPGAPQASACEGVEGCHGPASAAPSFANPASGSLSGAAQLNPSARRLQAARKACKKKPKKARAKCTANAKKHFTKAGRAH